jgi:hypothetical protein
MHPIWGVHVHTNLGIPVWVSSGHNDHSARPLPPNRGPSALAPGGPNPPGPARRPFIPEAVAHPTNMHTRPFGCGRLPRSGANRIPRPAGRAGLNVGVFGVRDGSCSPRQWLDRWADLACTTDALKGDGRHRWQQCGGPRSAIAAPLFDAGDRHQGVGHPNWRLRGCRYGCMKFSTEQGIQFTLMPVVGSPSDVKSLWCA